MRILLIEPDSILGAVYAEYLEVAGYTVARVYDAQQAIYAADEFQPELVILELQLVAHSGVAFIQEFRSYHDWLHIPIIIHSLIQPQQLALYQDSLAKLGVEATLYKPQTTLANLVRAIEQTGVPQNA